MLTTDPKQRPIFGFFDKVVSSLHKFLRAEKGSPHQGPAFFCRERCPRGMVFWVEDGGPGFTPEALVRAGEFLYTESSRTDPSHQGLGLYFARQVAQAHGGRLVLQNTPSGACAELWLTAEDTPKEA